MDKYGSIKKEILVLYNNEQYEECKKKCEEIAAKVDVENIIDKENIWWLYFRISLIYKKIGDKKKSINWLEKAIPYTILSYRIIQNYWMLGRLYESINRDIAIECYDYAIIECLKNDLNIFLISIVGNKAVLENDIQSVLNTLDIVDSVSDEECTQHYRTKEYLFNTIYENLSLICIQTKQILKANVYINKIKNNEKLKEFLFDRMSQAVNAC